MSNLYVGLTATIIGMSVVFAVLILLCIVLYFFKYLNPAPKPVVKEELPSDEDIVQDDVPMQEEAADAAYSYTAGSDENEVVAAIAASIRAYMQDSPFAIRSITPAAANPGSAEPTFAQGQGPRSQRAWNIAAKRENQRGLY